VGQVARALIVAIVASLTLGLALDSAAHTHCGDFHTQAEAQRHMATHLDRDGDGVACERLP